MSEGISFCWYDIESKPQEWDNHVASTDHGIFHRSAMLEVFQTRKAFRRGVMISRDGQSVGAVGGLLRPERGGGRYRTLSFPTRNLGIDPFLPRHLSNWLLDQGVTQIEFGSLGGGVEGYRDNPSGRILERVEFIYDLNRGEETRLEQVDIEHRRTLEGSLEPVKVKRIDSRQALLIARADRARQPRLSGLARMIERYRFYRRLIARMARDGSGSLYGLYDSGDRLTSIAYMLERTGASFCMIGADTDGAKMKGGTMRLFWELARYYPNIGVNCLNLGGVPSEASNERHRDHKTYRLKSGFGIKPTLRQSLTIEM